MNAETAPGPATLLIRGGTVLADPRSEPGPADVTISGSRISAVGAAALVGDSPARVIEAADHLVIPGLVNGHTHAHNNLSKGVIDGFPLEIWLQYLVARLGRLSPREIYVSAAIGAIEMAKSGVTCACDMAQVIPWPDEESLGAVLQAYADVGLRVACSAQVFDLSFVDSMPALRRLLPDEGGLGSRAPVPRDEVLATLRAVAGRWHGAAGGRIRFGIGANQVGLCSEEFLGECSDLARELGLGIQTHLVETRAEALSALDRFGISATAKLHELGLLGDRTVLAHAVWVSDDDLELIAASQSSISYNPISNLKLGSGFAPVLRMRDAGCNIALGTDGSASSDNQNLFAVIRLAAVLSRASEADHRRWFTPADSLAMAIGGGARAAGFGDEIGQVAPGYAADLVLIDLSTPYFSPRTDLVSQLVHCEVGSSVRTVVIDGRVVVEDGRVVTVDEPALLAEATEIARRISSLSAGRAGPTPPLVPFIERTLYDLARVDWEP